MKTLIFNWRDELIRIKPEEIVYFEADGNYSIMVLVSKKKQLLSMNLSKLMLSLEQMLGAQSRIFERVGRDLIIRKDCLYSIHIPLKQLVLTVPGTDVVFDLQVSKEALKVLKFVLQNNVAIPIQLRDLKTCKSYSLCVGDNCFGRKSISTKCNCVIDNGDSQISRAHFNVCITRINDIPNFEVTIIDLGSSNGTFLNEELISTVKPQTIEIGSRIRVGSTEFIVEQVDLDKTLIP